MHFSLIENSDQQNHSAYGQEIWVIPFQVSGVPQC
jgi:hypothetical protein